MLSRIKAFFDTELSADSEHTGEEKIRLACAALLIEIAVIDEHFDDSEFEAMQKILQNQFGISAQECEQLTELARSEREDSTSVYQFTQLINSNCSYQEKLTLLQGMWSIAYADGDLDKYEEYMIRKVADLIYVSHGDFIRTKHNARSDYAE